MADAAETKEEVKPVAVFGSGSTFGAGTGFAGFTGVSGSAVDAQAPAADGEEDAAAPEEECQAEFKPLVQLEEVETSTGEEDEEVLLDLKCKLYRFEATTNEWKERGIGQARLLQHKGNKKVRLLMRQEKTLKIRANHIVMPNTQLQEHSGSDKAWVWSAVDFADGEQKVELFCMRFGTAEKAKEFKSKFDEVAALNGELLADVPLQVAGDDGVAAAEADQLASEVEAKVAVEGE